MFINGAVVVAAIVLMIGSSGILQRTFAAQTIGGQRYQLKRFDIKVKGETSDPVECTARWGPPAPAPG